MHVAQLVDRGGLRRVGASWSKRKALRIAKDVHVAIARAWRNFEVHRRSGLRSAGKGIGCRSKQRCCSSSGSGDEKVTSSGHRFEFYCDLGTVEEHEPSEPAQASWKPRFRCVAQPPSAVALPPLTQARAPVPRMINTSKTSKRWNNL